MARGHAEALMPMVAEVMAGAGIGFAELDLIAATLGPGSFTGVRIAIAAARGFALVTKAKLWGTDSLTVMARAELTSGAIGGGTTFAVAVDARGDMLYAGLYDGEGRKLDGPLLIGADEAVALLPDDLAIAVGSGAVHLAEAAAPAGKASVKRCVQICSRAPPRSPSLRSKRTKRSRRCVRFTSARPTQSRKGPWRWRGADERRFFHHLHSPRRRLRCRGHGGDPSRLLCQELERGRDRTIRERARLSFAPRLPVTGTSSARVPHRREVLATRRKS